MEYIDRYEKTYHQPFKYRGDLQYRQTDEAPHQYYDPSIRTTYLNDIIASKIPNYSIDHHHVGKKYEYLTDYKKYIVKNNKNYHDRNFNQRSWWD